MTNTPTLTDARFGEIQSAVIQIGGQYCALVDSGRFDELVALFTEDAKVILPGREIIGSDELKKFFAAATPGIHLAGVPFVTMVSDSEVQSEQNFSFLKDGTSDVVLRGTYIDRLRLTAGGCQIISRTIASHPSAPPAA